MAVVAAALTACGGGGAGNAPQPTSAADTTSGAAPAPASPIGLAPAAPTPAAHAFHLVGAEQDHPAGAAPAARLLVVDPRSPTRPRLVLELGTTSADRWRLTRRQTFDASSRSSRFVGHPKLIALHGQRLWTVALALDADVEPVAIAPTIADACRLGRVLELDLRDGLDAWVEVERAGADADCAQAPDNVTDWVRTTRSSIAARWPSSEEMLRPLRSAEGALQHLLSLDHSTGRLGLREPAGLALTGVVDGGAGVQRWREVADEPDGGLAYAQVNGSSLHRLHWTADRARLSPALHTIASSLGGGSADARHLWFADGASIFRLAHGDAQATLHAALPAADGAVSHLEATQAFVLATQGSSRPQLFGVAQSEDAAITRLAGGPADPGGSLFVARHAEWVLHARIDASGSAQVTRTRADTAAAAMVKTGVRLVGTLLATDARADQPLPAGTLFCRPRTADALDCRGADLELLDAASGAVTRVGTLPAWTSPGVVQVAVEARAGQPVTFSASTVVSDTSGPRRLEEVLLLDPSAGGGLVRVSTRIP